MDIREKIFEVCGTNDLLALVLAGGDVRRYHQAGGHAYMQPVSEHTFRALLILLHFWPDASRELIVTLLYHDVIERVTGDPPATVKAVFPRVRAVYDDIESEVAQALGLPSGHDLEGGLDYIRLKVADYLELCITCKFQLERRPQQIYKRGIKFVWDYAAQLPEDEMARIRKFMLKLEDGTWES